MYLSKTYFSLRYGTFSTEELVKAAVEAGATTLALTNINVTCDAWDFVLHCRENGIKPILGVEIRNANISCYTCCSRPITEGFNGSMNSSRSICCRDRLFPKALWRRPFSHRYRMAMSSIRWIVRRQRNYGRTNVSACCPKK